MTEPQLEGVVGGAAPVIDRLTRLGFGAKGVLTMLVGVLALRFALGRGGSLTDQRGAIRSVLDQRLGLGLLAVLALGLAGYAVGMLVAAILDSEGKGTGLAGLAERAGFFVTGVGYAVLAYASVTLLLGIRGGGDTSLDDLAAALLTPRVGRWFVGLVGAIVMTAGVFQFRLGITAGFRNRLRRGLSRLERILVVVSGRLGYLTLGVLSLLVGCSLLQVALQYDPSQAGGWRDALGLLSGLSGGRWILGATSIGLILYGLYFVLLVRYRAL